MIHLAAKVGGLYGNMRANLDFFVSSILLQGIGIGLLYFYEQNQNCRKFIGVGNRLLQAAIMGHHQVADQQQYYS